MSKSIQLKKGNENLYPYAILKEYVLYENTTGEIGNITLSDNVENYKYVEIFYKRGEAFQDSTKIDLSISNRANLISTLCAGNTIYIDIKGVTLSGTTIINNFYRVFLGSGTFVHQDYNNIRICKVIGYK